VPVLRVGENAPRARLSAQINLNAATTARTTTAKLTQGPQSIAPAMTVIARRGKNDLPIAAVVFEKNPAEGGPMLRSFPLRISRVETGFGTDSGSSIFPTRLVMAARGGATGMWGA